MYIRVFPKGSNPAIDPPILRKSLRYCERQVSDLLADWCDPDDHSLGIIARELLVVPRASIYVPEPARPGLPPVEIDGLKFDDPEKDKAKLAERGRLVIAARTVAYFGADKDLTRLGAEEA